MCFDTKCKICKVPIKVLMNDTILGKYKINYYLCSNCNCIYTENPYWLEEAYNESIAITDTGIMARNISICNKLMKIFTKYFDSNIKVVDYGGGYGILTRMLRDNGVDALWQDKYSTNILSRGFEYDGISNADVILAFEVIEHLPNPLEVIKEIMSKTDCFIFSTQLLEKLDYKSNNEWWYFAPESGQHIFFSSEKTLYKIAEILKCKYTNINGLHILHRPDILVKANEKSIFNKISSKFHLSKKNMFKSKTWDDHIYLKSLKKL